MALGSYGHRITHQLRPINMNGRSILSETSSLSLIDKDIPAAISAREKASRDPWCKGQDPHLDPEAVIHEDRSQDPWGEPESFQQTFVGQLDPPIPQGKLGPIQEIPCQAEVDRCEDDYVLRMEETNSRDPVPSGG
jgi:hypothetical protein